MYYVCWLPQLSGEERQVSSDQVRVGCQGVSSAACCSLALGGPNRLPPHSNSAQRLLSPGDPYSRCACCRLATPANGAPCPWLLSVSLQLGIRTVFAEVLPAGKADKVQVGGGGSAGGAVPAA